MRHFKRMMTAFFVISLFSLASLNAVAHDHKQTKGKVTVQDAWARATFALAKTGAVYLVIDNQSKHGVKLLSVSVDLAVASEAQLHETLMEDDMMQMRQAESGFDIPAGETLQFEPGGKHIMLMGLEKPLTAGEQFVLSLHFQNNKVLRVPIDVKDAR